MAKQKLKEIQIVDISRKIDKIKELNQTLIASEKEVNSYLMTRLSYELGDVIKQYENILTEQL